MAFLRRSGRYLIADTGSPVRRDGQRRVLSIETAVVELTESYARQRPGVSVQPGPTPSSPSPTPGMGWTGRR
jgi:hypothetical protein